MNRLVAGPGALFSIFKTDQQQPENWPAAGNSDEETLGYRFSAGSAEAGLKQSGSNAKFFYKYLGFIQCQKEKLLAKLLPAGHYQPFSSACGLSSSSSPFGMTGACSQIVPQPYSAELSNLIDQAAQKDSIVKQVPKSVLMAIYDIEATIAYADPEHYTCSKTITNDLGLMQINDNTINLITSADERINPDEGVCGETPGKLSRCNPVDAIILAARTLIYKRSQIKTLADVYVASCNYYGSYEPTTATDNKAGSLPAHQQGIDGHTSYCEYVCIKSGFCQSNQDFPWPRGNNFN
jgi:hypothetical protein